MESRTISGRPLTALGGAAAITIGALTAGTSLIVPGLWVLALVGFIPLIHLSRKAALKRTSVLYGAIFGSIYGAVAFFPLFWDSLPLSWVFYEPDVRQYGLVAIGWLITVTISSITTAIFSLSVRSLKFDDWADIFLIPSLWVMAEAASSLLLSTAAWTPGSLIGPHISISFIGNVLADNLALLQFAAIGGIFGLSFIVLMANTASLLVFSKANKTDQRLALGVLIALIYWSSFGHLSIPNKPLNSEEDAVKVVAIHTNMPSDIENLDIEKERYLEQVIRPVMKAAYKTDPDLIVLPEGVGYLDWTRRTDGEAPHSRSSATVIVDSYNLHLSSASTVRAIELYSTEKKTSTYQYKQFLVPVGEYLPQVVRTIGRVLMMKQQLEWLESGRHFVRGLATPATKANNMTIGALFCNEILSPTLYTEKARSGGELFANLASHSRYHGSIRIQMQIERAARIRAAENRRALIMAHDISPALIIDQYGRVLASSNNESGFISSKVARSTTLTPYATAGLGVLAIPIYIILLAQILALSRLGRRNFKSTTRN